MSLTSPLLAPSPTTPLSPFSQIPVLPSAPYKSDDSHSSTYSPSSQSLPQFLGFPPRPISRVSGSHRFRSNPIHGRRSVSMAIVKNISRVDDEFSPSGTPCSEDVGTPSSSSETAGAGGATSSDSDSGMGQDAIDLSEMVEAGAEFCQVEDQSCSLPLDLHDLPDLRGILSVETWNECLTEEERFELTRKLPDMDQENFARTLSELFAGANFHFGSPLAGLFKQLKSGLCDPRVVLYRKGKNFLQRREYYHHLRTYHNSMVGRLVRIRDAWQGCEGYGIDERLRLLNVLRMRDRDVGFQTDSESEEMVERTSNKRAKTGYHYAKESINDRVKAAGTSRVSAKMKHTVSDRHGQYRQQDLDVGLDSGAVRRVRRRGYEDDYEDEDYEMSNQRDWDASQGSPARARLLKQGKNHRTMKSYYVDEDLDGYGRPSHYDRQVSKGNEKVRSNSAQRKGIVIGRSRNSPRYSQSSDRVSESSDQMEVNGAMNHLVGDNAYPSDTGEGHRPSLSKKSIKHSKMDREAYSHLVDGSMRVHSPPVEAYTSKVNQKGKIYESGYSHGPTSMKKGQISHPSDKLQISSQKTYATERNHKEMVDHEYSLQHPDYNHDHDNDMVDGNINGLNRNSMLANAHMKTSNSVNRSQTFDYNDVAPVRHDNPNMPLIGCSVGTTKLKRKPDELGEAFHQQSSLAKQSEDPLPLKKKGKKKADADNGPMIVRKPEPVELGKEETDIEVEMKAQKKPFTLITPTIHTGFSFSLIHFLSAIRKAMVTPNMEGTMGFGTFETTDTNKVPPLTVQEIVSRVKSNPGDPCILETQEPLQDLVRGALKIFAAKTAPLGAKGWKALVLYEKAHKVWTWVGPVLASSADRDTDEETSPEAWGIPHKMLVKLVDAFANWLKSGQDTLQRIGSLPKPPIMMLPNLDEKERFKDLRAQKSLNTFRPTTDEMRAYFRIEEHLRYSIPDRAFSYTAYDGKKSIVAPLRRGGGKPTSKPRDHFMLKIDRPPHVTILCLVRDAAARLPGSIGTRADVSTLIRDSQYIVEDITDEKVNQVVSGALDRLHYEKDPCVLYDSERKLWVYQHRDREEEDFDDEGTSSTKKWKRQRKDATDTPDAGVVNDVRFNASGDPAVDDTSARYDVNPDLNMESPYIHAGEQPELIYNGLRSNLENIHSYIVPTQGDRRHGNPMNWEVYGLNHLRENKMLCQQNSTNQEFDDGSFSRGRQLGS